MLYREEIPSLLMSIICVHEFGISVYLYGFDYRTLEEILFVRNVRCQNLDRKQHLQPNTLK